MAAAAAAKATTATTTAATALLLRACLVHHEVATTEILPVQGIDRAIRFFIVGNFDESKTTRLARKTVTNQIDC
jgi:hypothetical protein